MKNITNINRESAWLRTHPAPCDSAHSIMDMTGRDIYVVLPAGQKVRASWLDQETAYPVWGFICSLQMGSGDAIAKAIRAVIFHRDGVSVEIHLDWEEFEASGAKQPPDRAIRNGFAGQSYQVRTVLRGCEA